MQGGNIYLNSKVNEGTTLNFNLPYKREIGAKANLAREYTRLPRIDKKVLVAEDIEFNQLLVKNTLESWGCTVDIAANGLQAINKLKENQYDIILMDIQMPEMDGITATGQIRKMEQPEKANIPIIAFTSVEFSSERRYHEAGMNSYILKPYTEQKLHEKITEVLKMHSLNPTAPFKGNLLNTDDKNKQMTDDDKSKDELKLYDVSMLELISKGKPAFVEKMLLMFVEVITDDFGKLKDAAGKNSWAEVSQIAHKMKSTLGNMSVTTLLPGVKALETGTDDRLLELEKLDAGITQVLSQIKNDYPALFGQAT